jgi:hypothetical protein
MGSTVSITATQKSVTISGLNGIVNGGNYYFYIRSINLYINSFTASVTTTSTTTTTTTVQPNIILVTQAYVDSTTFPVTVSGTGKSVKLMENITTTKSINFVFPEGSSVTFDGQGNTITLSGVAGYGGLISSASNSTLVQNVGILTANNSNLADEAGWVGSTLFIGGISNCYSTGDISAGGIAGSYAGSGGSCTISNCYSTGDTDAGGGGIVGFNAGNNGGSCTISNCYSTGRIYYIGGGIVGAFSGNGGSCNININNCYSTGAISVSSGGIFNISNSTGGTCNINNCYSTGAIKSQSGGIVGWAVGTDRNCKINVTNCYVTGSVSSNSGAIASPGTTLTTNTNNPNTAGWIDTSVPFDNKTDTTVWKVVKTNTPWKLVVFLSNTSYAFNTDDTSITYSSIDFPISPLSGNIELVDSNGTTIGSTVSITNTQKNVTISGLSGITYGEKYYFYIRSINLYINSFTTSFTASLLVTQAYVDSTTFPVTVSGSRISVLLMENIITTKNIQFIFPGDSSVKFDGQGNTITLSGVKNYTGLINSASNSTIVQNLGILTSNNSTLANEAGWIGCSYYAGTVTNCYSTGDIGGEGSGGIVGSYFVDSDNTIVNITTSISNCYSTGSISGNGSGGIVGSYAGSGGYNYDYIYLFRCNVSNCYSTGNIDGINAGGITGYRSSFNYFDFNLASLFKYDLVCSISSCIISNCYSSGAIIGTDSGGIVGSEACSYWLLSFNRIYKYRYRISRTLLITNCYTSGNIFGSNSGGILGARACRGLPAGAVRDEDQDREPDYEYTTYAYLNINITKCYVIGNNVNGDNYIYGSNSLIVVNFGNGLIVQVIRTSNNTYTAGWVDRSANDVLDANIYFKVSPSPIRDVPYKLLIFLYTSNASLNGTTLTYSNIWPIIGFNSSSTYLTDNGGNRVSTGTATLDTTGKILTIPSVSITSTQSSYSLVVSGQYFDRFTLVGNYIVRLRFTADYLQVIVSPETYASFKTSLQQAIATALRVTLDKVVVLNLSPGSILAEIYVPPDLIGQLQSIVESGNLNVEFNGTTYPADPNYFVVIDDICFHRDTLILTPNGYRKVQSLQRGHLVKTAQGREVPIKRITSFTGSREKCPLHVMYKDTIAPNVPIQDLYMSGGHAFYNNGKWRHMKCSDLTTKLDVDNIEYYNIVLDNYMENTLIANGLEVESLFEMEGLKMHWRCEEKCCKPVIERAK